MLESMGQHPSDEQVQELIKAVDTDGGGSIGFDEFLTLMTQVLRLLALLVTVYLLYWLQVLSLPALLVQKSKY